MNPKLRKIGLIAGIIAILVVWAFLYWLLCIPEPAQEIRPQFTPAQKVRIKAGIKQHGDYPMFKIGDQIFMVRYDGKVRI
jgi:hypothetical protein